MTATQAVHDIIAAVPDPELPMISIADLGIVRAIEVSGATVRVTITPTYSGCPAMDAIRDDILAALRKRGLSGIVDMALSPA